jgi:hypothetical protein
MVSQETGILGICAAITAGIQFIGFLVAYAMQTEKFYDILGGINFLALGIYSAIDGEFEGDGGAWKDNGRKIAATILFSVSRSWLLLFLAWRAHGEYVSFVYTVLILLCGLLVLVFCRTIRVVVEMECVMNYRRCTNS